MHACMYVHTELSVLWIVSPRDTPPYYIIIFAGLMFDDASFSGSFDHAYYSWNVRRESDAHDANI